jgi:hypothetical protein
MRERKLRGEGRIGGENEEEEVRWRRLGESGGQALTSSLAPSTSLLLQCTVD